MEKSNLHTTPYSFKDTEILDGINYHYTAKRILKKQKFYKVQDSCTSKIVDLNENKRIALIIHFHTIRKAIEYAKRQCKQGVSESMHIPLPELDQAYWHRVWMVAKRAIKLEETGISKETSFAASQPFWVDQYAIIAYGFRKDKDLSSKFQAFVEFKNANRMQPSIKLNLQMSKLAYKHMNEIYLDGFDLVKHSNQEFSIRHVSQKLVRYKEPTGIDKLIFVDKWLNLYSILVDRNGYNEKGLPYYDEKRKIVNGYIHKSHKCSTLNRLFLALTNKLSAKRYNDILHRFKMSLKARLMKEINSDNEDNVTLLLPEYHHKVANHINRIAHDIVKDLCNRKGIKLNVIVKEDTIINNIVEKHKQALKQNRKPYEFKTKHVKWQEYAYAAMLLKYQGFYPYLRKSGKSFVPTVKSTPQQDEEELRKEYERLLAIQDEIYDNYGKDEKSNKLFGRFCWLTNHFSVQYVEPEFV